MSEALAAMESARAADTRVFIEGMMKIEDLRGDSDLLEYSA